MWNRWTLLLISAWCFIAAARIAGPSDLYDKEQPRTTSYTVDILLNHRWILPHDTFGIPATKPPLYNWLTVPFAAIFGIHEWTLKIPSLLASLITVLLIAHVARQFTSPTPQSPAATAAGYKPSLPPDHASPNKHDPLALLAPLLWLACPVTVKLLYVARPDMLLVACLTAAWSAATSMIAAPRGAGAPRAALAFWLCTLLAALDKGPLALFAPLYLVLAAWLIRRDPKILARTGWWWGAPLVLLVMGAWAWAACQQEPLFFRQVLLGREVADRVASPVRFFQTFFNGPAYLFTRFLPWSLLVILALWRINPRQWFRRPPHRLAPAILWLLLWLIIFSFATTKRPDRYAPVYPAMALLAAYALLHFLRHRLITLPRLAAAALALILGLCIHNQFFSTPATTRLGDHVIAFANDIRSATAGQPILFLDAEQSPLETLLAHDQSDPPTAAELANARWIVRMVSTPDAPQIATQPAVRLSDPIDQIDGPNPARLGLFRVAPPNAAAEFQATATQAVLYDDGTGKSKTEGTAASAQQQYLQFWRLHRPLASARSTPTPPP